MSMTTKDSIEMEKPEWLGQIETVLEMLNEALPGNTGHFCKLGVGKEDPMAFADDKDSFELSEGESTMKIFVRRNDKTSIVFVYRVGAPVMTRV